MLKSEKIAGIVALSSSSESSSGKTVPLVIYDGDGKRTEIGTATVVQKGTEFHVEATVTDPLADGLGFDQGPFSIAYNVHEKAISEAAVIPPLGIQRPRYKK